MWGKELYFDGTQVEANADDTSMMPRFYVEAMRSHLAALFPEQSDQEQDDAQFAAPGTKLLSLASKLPQSANQPTPTDEAQGQDWISRLGRPHSREKNSSYQRIADLRVSTTDPDATLMRTKGGGGSRLGYHTHYVVDGGMARIIVNALVTPAEVQDNQPMLDLLWRTMFRWYLKPKQVTGDTKYGTVENIAAVEQQGIRAYVPLPN